MPGDKVQKIQNYAVADSPIGLDVKIYNTKLQSSVLFNPHENSEKSFQHHTG
jgi:hypothetical protein